MRADAVGTCIYPQINYLGTMLRYLPRACFVLNTRPTAHWLNSVSQWAGLRPRLLRNCPIWPRNETGLGRWYDDYKQRTSARLRAWGGCYLEVDIEREDLTARLDHFFAMNASAECLATHTHASRVSYAPPRARG